MSTRPAGTTTGRFVHGVTDEDGYCVLGGLPPDMCGDCKAGRQATPKAGALAFEPQPEPTFGSLAGAYELTLDEPDPHEVLDREPVAEDLLGRLKEDLPQKRRRR